MDFLQPEYYRDEDRGTLIQVVSGPFKQLNILKINQDFTFGGHYHKFKKEIFYVVEGLVKAIIVNEPKGTSYTGYLKPNDMILVEPFDKHSFTAIIPTTIAEVMTEPYSEEDSFTI
jgi:oxalate decarboxylase/phosphoglucose isomerase-like protein (cupin superfamily)